MNERTPGKKLDEQFPLLKGDMDGKESTSSEKKSKPSGAGSNWKVNCVKTPSFYSRWPELMWACWISISFFGLYLLFIYVTTCIRGGHLRFALQSELAASNRPGSDVYFHHIVPKDSGVPFSIYSNYLTSLAKDYPKLRINVFFLIDDFAPAPIMKHSHLFPSIYTKRYDWKNKIDQFDRSVLENTLKAYSNLRVTVMSIKSYMDTTPLKYRWRLIPAANLAFYARVYSVWEHGGIGLDLTSFNNQFSIGENMDKRISMLLKQHNDGIDYNAYEEILESEPERDDELGMIKFLSNFMNDLFTIMQTPQQLNVEEEKLHNRKSRSKRNAKDAPVTTDTQPATTDSTETTTFVTETTVHENTTDLSVTTAAAVDYRVAVTKTNATSNTTLADELISNSTDHKHKSMVMFYKVFLFPDKKPEPLGYDGLMNNMKSPAKSKPAKSLLTIDADGLFVATPSRQHPFLCQIMSGASQRMAPRSAIDTAYLEQCSNMLRNDVYCKSIYVKQFLMTTVFF